MNGYWNTHNRKFWEDFPQSNFLLECMLIWPCYPLRSGTPLSYYTSLAFTTIFLPLLQQPSFMSSPSSPTIYPYMSTPSCNFLFTWADHRFAFAPSFTFLVPIDDSYTHLLCSPILLLLTLPLLPIEHTHTLLHLNMLPYREGCDRFQFSR